MVWAGEGVCFPHPSNRGRADQWCTVYARLFCTLRKTPNPCGPNIHSKQNIHRMASCHLYLELYSFPRPPFHLPYQFWILFRQCFDRSAAANKLIDFMRQLLALSCFFSDVFNHGNNLTTLSIKAFMSFCSGATLLDCFKLTSMYPASSRSFFREYGHPLLGLCRHFAQLKA